MRIDQQRALEQLDFRLRIILPEEYQDAYKEMEPTPMGSAGLKYAADGTVAWNEIWGSFCDLAMAGGPPHKGRLLEPATPAEIAARPDRHQEVVDEICRGITMVTDLPAREAPAAGWIRVTAFSDAMAGWLVRAIVTENVAVRADGMALELPASPAFRLDKEIKNVITVIAKTCHYWLGHTPCAQQRAIADLLLRRESESPLIVPGAVEKMVPGASAPVGLSRAIERATGLKAAHHQYRGWLGVECPTARAAIWMMRMMVASNALSRREGTVLFLPVNDVSDAGGESVTRLLTRVHRFAAARSIV